MLKAPCYDYSSNVDCPLRKVNCRASCTDWKRYEERKAVEAAKKKKERIRQDVSIGYANEMKKHHERRMRKK